MVKILALKPDHGEYTRARFAVELEKEEIAKVQRMIVGFWTLSEKNGKIWVNPPSRKDPETNEFKPVFWADVEWMDRIKEKVRDAVKQALNAEFGAFPKDDPTLLF